MTTPIKAEWTSPDGSVRLLLGDCLAVLPTLEAGSVDAVIDPPYGIGEAANNNKSRSCLASSRDYGRSTWDNQLALKEVEATRAVSIHQVIFGGNYYPLPPASCWLVWDKMNGKNDFADCELAWTNNRGAVRRKRFRWHGMIRDEKGPRYHPTQKPVAVMEWAIGFAKSQRPICDSMMGSGTTGVACIRTGRRFIGIEIEPKYFDIAVKRCKAELERFPLFEKPKSKQLELLP